MIKESQCKIPRAGFETTERGRRVAYCSAQPAFLYGPSSHAQGWHYLPPSRGVKPPKSVSHMLVSVESRPEYDLAFEYDFFLGSVTRNPTALTPRDTANKPSCFESQRVNLDAAVVYNEDQRDVIPVPPVFSHHRLHGISNTLGSRCGPSRPSKKKAQLHRRSLTKKSLKKI